MKPVPTSIRTTLGMAVLALGACAWLPTQTRKSTEPNAPLERAQAAAQAFGSQLRSTLQSAMQGGGPEAAVQVCNSAAPAIAEAAMREHGVRLGRVAAPGRNRNPAQAAAGWQLDELRKFQQAVAAGLPAPEQASVIRDRLPEGVALRMVRGIATEPVCTTCHGGNVAPAMRVAIARLYPGDGATGFEVGDLRGALWVEVPMSTDNRN